jgi:hypothetical protein
MEEDVTSNPVDVGFFGSQAVMLHPENFAYLIAEFGHARDFNTESGFIPQICG